MRASDFITEAPLDFLRTSDEIAQRKASAITGQVSQAAKKLGDIAGQQWLVKIRQLQQAKTAAGEDKEISQSEYLRTLTDFINTNLLKNKPIVDRNSKVRINKIIKQIMTSRDQEQQVQKLFVPLIQTIMGALRSQDPSTQDKDETPSRSSAIPQGAISTFGDIKVVYKDGFWTTASGTRIRGNIAKEIDDAYRAVKGIK